MITNERQYRITKAQAERFRQALDSVDEQTAHLTPRLRQAMRDGLASQLEELRDHFAEYEALQTNPATTLEFDSLADLPETLIRARIAVGLTQQALAKRLGLKQQQIQRYEAQRYAGVSLQRVAEIAEALGMRVRGQGHLVGASASHQPTEHNDAP